MTPSSPEEAPASPTPRTDSVRLPINSHTLPADVVFASFARGLERELAIANLALQLSSPHEKALIADANKHREEAVALRQRLEAAELDTKRFRDALEALHGEQNGPPLIRHEKTWRAAYDRATELLYPEFIDAAMKASQPQSPTP